MRDFVDEVFIQNDLDILSDYSENDLPPDREPEDIERAILNEEINPFMPTEDVENNVGYLFIYYYYTGRGTPEIEFDIPDTWEQWATTFATLTNPPLWETQLVGQLQDREGIEIRTRQLLEELKNRGVIREYRIRKNYVIGYE
jgi:hypothetical protein